MSLQKKVKKILITGSDGFIAKNLKARLSEISNIILLQFSRGQNNEELAELISKADLIFHLAGENRPKKVEDFALNNAQLTKTICEIVKSQKRKIPIIFSSSTQAVQDNDYGKSKLQAEKHLQIHEKETGSPVHILRLPGIFGKWCKPNYNSVVATFCYNVVNNFEITISDDNKILTLCYIDDLIDDFLDLIDSNKPYSHNAKPSITYSISLKDLYEKIMNFKNSRMTHTLGEVGEGMDRALYSTYVSYLPKKDFSYELKSNVDDRGNFVEMLKTKSSGQFSFFTSKPGITRGVHYHHTKTEKFLVLKGKARFRFRSMLTNETHEIFSDELNPTVVESIPGWTHDIKNIGDDIMIVMLWANEIFDSVKPDTYSAKTF